MPYSFFNAYNYRPPIIGFSSTGEKDSLRNTKETSEFVWHLATRDFAERMNVTSASVPDGVSEFEFARSVSHLLDVVETLEYNSAHFRSLRDPIDTTTSQGMFTLQILALVAQLERALFADRSDIKGRRQLSQ